MIPNSMPQQPEMSHDPIFAEMIERAFASPLIINLADNPQTSPEDLEHRRRYYSKHSSLPEHMKIKSYESPSQEYEVITRNPQQYLLLLRQAMQSLRKVKGDNDIEDLARLEKVALHEITHGAMASAFGLTSKYGVRVLNDPNNQKWAISPFHSAVGDEGVIMLTRLEEASIAVAPEDASPADLFKAECLGYPSRSKVLEALASVRPDLFTATGLALTTPEFHY